MAIITDNYIWFLISGGVLFLITIGYFAELSNFGKRKITENVVDDVGSNVAPHFSNELLGSNAQFNDNYSAQVNSINQPNTLFAEEVARIPDGAITSILQIDRPIVSDENSNDLNMNNSPVTSDIVDVIDDDIVVSDVSMKENEGIDSLEIDVNQNDSNVWKF